MKGEQRDAHVKQKEQHPEEAVLLDLQRLKALAAASGHGPGQSLTGIRRPEPVGPGSVATLFNFPPVARPLEPVGEPQPAVGPSPQMSLGDGPANLRDQEAARRPPGRRRRSMAGPSLAAAGIAALVVLTPSPNISDGSLPAWATTAVGSIEAVFAHFRAPQPEDEAVPPPAPAGPNLRAVAAPVLAAARQPALAPAPPNEALLTEMYRTLAAERERALEQERVRAEELARELASAKVKLDAVTAAPTLRLVEDPIPNTGAIARRSEELRGGTWFDEQPPTTSGSRNVQVALAAPELPASTPQPAPPPVSAAASTASPAPALGPGPAPAPTPAPSSADPARDQRMLERARGLLQARDVAGARLLLERIVDAGGGEAAFLLGQAYDPAVLGGWRVHGIVGDDARAQSLYAHARALGYAGSPPQP